MKDWKVMNFDEKMAEAHRTATFTAGVSEAIHNLAPSGAYLLVSLGPDGLEGWDIYSEISPSHRFPGAWAVVDLEPSSIEDGPFPYQAAKDRLMARLPTWVLKLLGAHNFPRRPGPDGPSE